jgi:hypothetical protein
MAAVMENVTSTAQENKPFLSTVKKNLKEILIIIWGLLKWLF